MPMSVLTKIALQTCVCTVYAMHPVKFFVVILQNNLNLKCS